MAVEIQISANSSSAQAAIRRLVDELKRLRQAGEAFGQIKLDGATEGLRRDLEGIQRNYRDLLNPRLGGSFARRVKETGQQDAAPELATALPERQRRTTSASPTRLPATAPQQYQYPDSVGSRAHPAS